MGKIHIYIFVQVYYLESLASETTSEQKSMQIKMQEICPLCVTSSALFRWQGTTSATFWRLQKTTMALYFVWDISELWYFTHHLGHLFLFQLDYKLYDTTMVFREYQNTRIMYAVRKWLVYLNAHTLV